LTQGHIDVWALRKDVIAVSSTPVEQRECRSGGGDIDQEYVAGLKTRKAHLAYERKRRKEVELARKTEARCENDNLKQREKFNQLHTAFNAHWVPALKNAMQLGDPVAEVILRLCETAPLLDRSEIAADCSEKEEGKAYARQRLEAIDFKPSLHNYIVIHGKGSRARQATCKWNDAGTECAFRADIAHYEHILSVMRTGYLSVAESWNTCQIGNKDSALDKLVEECQGMMNMMMALSAGVD